MRPDAPRPGREPEPGEWRDAALTFVPAIAAAVLLNWALVSLGGWPPRRALGTSIAVGIAIGVVLERLIDRRRGRG